MLLLYVAVIFDDVIDITRLSQIEKIIATTEKYLQSDLWGKERY